MAWSKPAASGKPESRPIAGFFGVVRSWISFAMSYSRNDSLSGWKNGMIACPSVEFVPASASAQNAPAPNSPAPVAKHQTAMPSDWNGTVDQTVSVQGVEGLKFSLGSFDVKPGARVKLDFANTSDMLHNLVVVRPGTGTKVGEAALRLGLDGQKLDYVPKSDDVLFNTSLLEPQKVESIYFVAPTTPGEYQYVCTFPGHYVTMQGTMRVIR